MSVTTKQILDLIIGLTERLDSAETTVAAQGEILEGWTDCFRILHERLEFLEAPKTFTPTGDTKTDDVIAQFNAWIEDTKAENAAIHGLVFELKAQIEELHAEREARDSRFGKSIDVNALRDLAVQAEKDTLQGFRI